MSISIVPYDKQYLLPSITIWNEVVQEGTSFPQLEPLTKSNGHSFFGEQNYTGLAMEEETKRIVGLYILHPNNVGRCGHLCNASYAVLSECRGRGIGELLVKDCIVRAREQSYRILQFNAVVASNQLAIHLYKKLGFQQLGAIPGGFLMPDGSYEDIIPHYLVLAEVDKQESSGKSEKQETSAIAYVDGSYNVATKEYSYGMVVLIDGQEITDSGKGKHPELASMRNVAGELMGARAAMQYALDHHVKKLTIYYDYEGIAKWCLGEWKANKEGTKAYKTFYEQIKNKISISFVKVKAHSADHYNDMADALAKQAIGMS